MLKKTLKKYNTVLISNDVGVEASENIYFVCVCVIF